MSTLQRKKLLGKMQWQSQNTTNEAKRKYILENKLWCDCRFLVDTETISAHKLILAKASPVFAEMFYGKYMDRYGNEPFRVPVMKSEAFRLMLEYIYTGSVLLPAGLIPNMSSILTDCQVWYGAMRFELPILAKQASSAISKLLSSQNACLVYQFALMYEENDFLKICEKILTIFTGDVLKSTSFNILEPKTVTKILSLQSLNVESELELLEAVERYIEAREQKKLKSVDSNLSETTNGVKSNIGNNTEVAPSMVLGKVDSAKETESIGKDEIRNIMKKIRLLSLSAQQLSEFVSRSALLSAADAAAVLAHARDERCDLPMPDGFSTSRERRRQTLQLEMVPNVAWCEQREEQEEQEGAREKKKTADIFIKCTVENLKNTKMAVSQPFTMLNVSYEIMLYRAQYLYIYLKPDSVSNRKFLLEILLISHKPHTRSFYEKFEAICNKEVFCKLLPFAVVTDPGKGYLEDGALTMELHFSASASSIIRQHRESGKKTRLTLSY